ncbi:MAG: hypothetical protein JKY95_19325 [Planctomycetaceae bacterium]|nr:hypothetical protein [Planctomycetaceae bacterium]
MNNLIKIIFFTIIAVTSLTTANDLYAAGLSAGVAKVDVTHPHGLINDRSYVRALVIKNGETTAVIVSVDAVAIGEIGKISNDYLGNVRSQIQKDLKIKPEHMLFNASHCHSVVCNEIEQLTVQAIKQAASNMVPVTIGVGSGHEDRIMENRRLLMADGTEIDVRHAYSLPPDAQVKEVGPVDPEIGILRLNRADGRVLAVVYQFACHPIQGVPSGGNTADITGFSSSVIEDNLGEETVALFIQGCGGDINPVHYKDVDYPRDAEPLGNLLALSTLKAVRKLECKADNRLAVINEVIELPGANYSQRIASMEDEQTRLMNSLRGTTLNLKSFLPLAVKYKLSETYPTTHSFEYLHEKMIGKVNLKKLDIKNRNNINQYLKNIYTMEQLTRVNTNLRLLRKHQAEMAASGKRNVDVELVGLRIGDFVLLTFPGELTVQIGLNIKKASKHEKTFVSGYTNGYIYYAPTAKQLLNPGGAQEDCDCLLAPEWQKIFEDKALEMLGKL